MRGRRTGHKYGAVATEVDGIRFASKKESRRYRELKVLEQVGQIRHLRIQPVLHLMAPVFEGGLENVNEGRVVRIAPVGQYRADFRYEEQGPRGWRVVFEDVKGVRTDVYKLKKRIVEAQYSIEIREI